MTLLWALTRDTALTAYVALTLTVALGLLRPLARQARVACSRLVDTAHGFTATLAVLLTVAHLLTLIPSHHYPLGWLDLALPGPKAGGRTLGANLGILALDALAAVALTSLARRRMTYRVWRRWHMVSFAAFALVTAHGWLAGADTHQPAIQALYVAATAVIVTLAALRLVTRVTVSSPERTLSDA